MIAIGMHFVVGNGEINGGIVDYDVGVLSDRNGAFAPATEYFSGIGSAELYGFFKGYFSVVGCRQNVRIPAQPFGIFVKSSLPQSFSKDWKGQ